MSQISLGNVTIDSDAYQVGVAGRRVHLTFVEFELLLKLASEPEHVLSRQQLLRAVRKDKATAARDTLTVHIWRLRQKLSDIQPWRIKTIRQRGYVLTQSA